MRLYTFNIFLKVGIDFTNGTAFLRVLFFLRFYEYLKMLYVNYDSHIEGFTILGE